MHVEKHILFCRHSIFMVQNLKLATVSLIRSKIFWVGSDILQAISSYFCSGKVTRVRTISYGFAILMIVASNLADQQRLSV